MNEVSIIINGVRYDAVEGINMEHFCDGCDLLNSCIIANDCGDIIGIKRVFKKSDKKFEERGRMTAKDAERLLRCAWYGDKVPKWLRVKYPKLSRGIHGQSDLNRQVVENILGRKENANL